VNGEIVKLKPGAAEAFARFLDEHTEVNAFECKGDE
jgi:hypothetical protein